MMSIRVAYSIRLVRFTFELNIIADACSGLYNSPLFVHLDNRPVKNLDVIQTFDRS